MTNSKGGDNDAGGDSSLCCCGSLHCDVGSGFAVVTEKPVPVLKPATQEDVEAFYGRPPAGTLRGWTATLDGKVVGVGGIFNTGFGMGVFLEIHDELQRHRKFLLRAVKEGLHELGKSHQSVLAFANKEIPTAKRFLKHFGFTPTGIHHPEHGEILIRRPN